MIQSLRYWLAKLLGTNLLLYRVTADRHDRLRYLELLKIPIDRCRVRICLGEPLDSPYVLPN